VKNIFLMAGNEGRFPDRPPRSLVPVVLGFCDSGAVSGRTCIM
jgi:hypothetical protein